MTASGVSAFATTHRMRHGVHRRTTHTRANSLPAIAAGLADDNAGVFAVADHTDGGSAAAGNTANFAAWQSDLGPASFSGVKRCTHAGTAAELSAATGLHLDVVHHCAERNCAEWHAVTDVGLDPQTAFDAGSGRQPLWGENITLFPVGILNQSDAGRAIGVVLDMSHGANHAVFVSLEIDDAIESLVTTTTVLGGNLALVVTSTLLLVADAEFFLGALAAVGDFREITDGRAAASGSNWFVEAETHDRAFVEIAIEQTVGMILEEGNTVFGVQFDDGLLPVASATGLHLVPAWFAKTCLGSHFEHAN